MAKLPSEEQRRAGLFLARSESGASAKCLPSQTTTTYLSLSDEPRACYISSAVRYTPTMCAFKHAAGSVRMYVIRKHSSNGMTACSWERTRVGARMWGLLCSLPCAAARPRVHSPHADRRRARRRSWRCARHSVRILHVRSCFPLLASGQWACDLDAEPMRASPYAQSNRGGGL